MTDQVRAASPYTTWLTSSSLSQWNFGTLAQRLDASAWDHIFDGIRTTVAPWIWPLVLLGLIALFRQPRQLVIVVLGLTIGSLLTVTTFFNLYFVHGYYLCAVSIPIWILAACGISELATFYSTKAWRIASVALPLLALALTSTYSPYVSLSYNYLSGAAYEFLADQIVPFSKRVISQTPPDAELIIYGDDWNSRIPYYTRRKAFMVKDGIITDGMTIQYAANHGVRYVVSRTGFRGRAKTLWPQARKVFSHKDLVLYDILPDTPK